MANCVKLFTHSYSKNAVNGIEIKFDYCALYFFLSFDLSTDADLLTDFLRAHEGSLRIIIRLFQILSFYDPIFLSTYLNK